MKNIILYADRLGHPSRFCIQFLQINKIQFEEVKVSLFSGECANHPDLPLKQIPVLKGTLEDTNEMFSIVQSTTILRYLNDKLPKEIEGKWYPKNLEKRAKVDEFIDFFHFSLNPVSQNSIFHIKSKNLL